LTVLALEQWVLRGEDSLLQVVVEEEEEEA
jgi:hypothetical protein